MKRMHQDPTVYILHVLLASAAALGLQLRSCVALEESSCPVEPEPAAAGGGWSWDRVLKSRGPIVANGNVWPPPEDESASDCLLLVSFNQLMWECPPAAGGDDGSEGEGEGIRSTLYRGIGRIRGAVSAPGTDRRRLWVLDSPEDHDRLMELDTVTGAILQTVIVDETLDGHDIVRVEDRIFMADTRNGHVVEMELPASAAPYADSSVLAGAKPTERDGFATVVKRHTGFTRQDHINNVAVHPQLLIASLHGGRRDSETRLSALSRSIPEEKGRELNAVRDGFVPVNNVGTWCHGIAFWEDKQTSQVKLISLDSKEGSMVSVVLAGPNQGSREVIWDPDLERHPVLVPPEGVARTYKNGAKVFSKGIAVQGGVAYFGVSYARSPALRRTVPESLLVAVDLTTRQELWARTIRSNGLINQIVTQSHLGWSVQLPDELSTLEITYHGDGGRIVELCENDLTNEESTFCTTFEEEEGRCDESGNDSDKARDVCCACDGGKWSQTPYLAGNLDAEILNLHEDITATVTFAPKRNCLSHSNVTHHLPLEWKTEDQVIDQDVGRVVKHVCNLNVDPIKERLSELGDVGFTEESQLKHGNAIITGRRKVMTNIKPNTTSIQLIFSSRDASTVYHFPELERWLPMLQAHVLRPLGIPIKRVIRFMFANMPKGSTINFHQDLNPWVQRAHRVHVPIITHPKVFFLTEIPITVDEEDYDEDIIRIRSMQGEVFEFNNAMYHAVRNLGESRVHLILDWIEEDVENLVKLQPGDRCAQLLGSNELQCDYID